MKKFLSMLLALCIMATMLTGTIIVSADKIEMADVAEGEDSIITLWDAEYWGVASAGDITGDTIKKDSATVWYHSYTTDSKLKGNSSFGLVSGSESGSSVTAVEDPLDSENRVFEVKSNLIQSNYRQYFDDPKNNPMGDNNVLSFSSRMMIPAEQPDGVTKTDITRTWSLPYKVKLYEQGVSYSSQSKTKFYNTADITVAYEEGKPVVSASISGTGARIKDTVVVEEDKYFNITAECFVNDGSKLLFAIYVDGQLIYLGESSNVYNKTETTVDETTSTETIKNYHIGFDLLKFSQTKKEAVTYLDEYKITSHNITTLPILAVGDMDEETITAAKSSGDILKSKVGYYQVNFQQSGNSTKVDTTYTLEKTADDETVINIKQSGKGLTRVLSNIRKRVSTPVISIDATDPIYLECSYDIYIPEDTVGIERKFIFPNNSSVRAEGANDNSTFDDPGMSYVSVIKDNKLSFSSSMDEKAIGYEFAKFSRMSEEVPVSPNTFINVKYVLEITGEEATGYNVKVYGIVDENNLAYVDEVTYPAGEFGINQIVFDIDNTTTSAVDTKIDNFNISTHTSYAIPEKTWDLVDYAYSLYFVQDNDNVVVEGLILKSSLTAADLVVAFYDANGKLIAPVTKKALTNTAGEDFGFTEKFAIPTDAVKAKAFVFDNLTSARALVEHGELEIK